MRRKLLSVALLAAMLVVAGCVGGTGNGASMQETTATDGTTMAETTSGTTAAGTTGAETETTVSSADLPPGVNGSGIENATALAMAHADALDGTGYAFDLTANVSMMSGERTMQSNTTMNGTVAANASEFLVHLDGEAMYGNVSRNSSNDVWANESVILYRVQREDRTRYQRLNRSSRFSTDYGAQLSGSSLVATALQTGNFSVESVERTENGTLTTLVATGYNHSLTDRGEEMATDSMDDASTETETMGGESTDEESMSEGSLMDRRAAMEDLNVTTYDATMVVDEEGRVHELDMTIAVEVGNRTSQTIDYHYELTRVGNVTVSQPDWTTEALNSSPSAGGFGGMTTTQTATTETNTTETTGTETTAESAN